MPTASASFVYNIATDADFRSWVAGVSALLQTASGLVKTTDTGQIDATTVTVGASIVTSRGYEIYRFNDSLQATKPVYIKIEYGTGSVLARPGMWVTVGTGSNGAGTITGQIGTRQSLIANAAPTSGVAYLHYVSVSTDRLVLATGIDTVTGTLPIMIAVERTRDSTGTATGDGITTIFGCGVTATTNNFFFQLIPFLGAIATAVTAAPVVAPGHGSIAASGTDVALAVPQIFLGKPFYMLGLVLGRAADLGSGTFTAIVLGSTHTYLAFGASLSALSMHGTNAATGVEAWAILWE